MPNWLTTEAKNFGIFLTSYPKKAFFGWLSSFPLPPLWVFTSPLSPPSSFPLSFHTHTLAAFSQKRKGNKGPRRKRSHLSLAPPPSVQWRWGCFKKGGKGREGTFFWKGDRGGGGLTDIFCKISPLKVGRGKADHCT